jgi:alpha-beta hydrolase superfamily lysophospholipase
MRACTAPLVAIAEGRGTMARSGRALLRVPLWLVLSVGIASAIPMDTQAQTQGDLSDATLAQSLPGGFKSEYARVNRTGLHYVAGGEGSLLVLLPGWPQTWWQFRKIMPALAERYRVIAIDLRGMGGSDKPASGYDKKTMAQDIHQLIRHLGYDRVNIAGHDIGAMVAYSFAANHPEGPVRLPCSMSLIRTKASTNSPCFPRPASCPAARRLPISCGGSRSTKFATSRSSSSQAARGSSSTGSWLTC